MTRQPVHENIAIILGSGACVTSASSVSHTFKQRASSLVGVRHWGDVRGPQLKLGPCSVYHHHVVLFTV